MKSFLYYFVHIFLIALIGIGIAFIFSESFSFAQTKINDITIENNLEDNPATIPGSTALDTSTLDIINENTSENTGLINQPAVIPEKEVSNEDIENSFKSITQGMLMFRGNPERNFYGKGPVPEDPKVVWRYPEKPMCSLSTSLGITKTWCGAGWTGQPIVWEHDSKTEIIFGGYDGSFHFIDSISGQDVRRPFKTDNIIKGSATLDPDGYPLLYGGSRDNFFRIFSLEGKEVKELWKLDSDTLGGIWNNDWDSNPVVVNDILYEGCENGIFYAIKLNRSYDANGHVLVNPQIIFSYKTYNDNLIKLIGDSNLSIENSTLIVGNRAYIANSGGRILGFDISNIENGFAPVVFDYWVGDDTDATLISDNEGMIYVTTELERWSDRSLTLGQFIKLDPFKEDPYVWGIKLLPRVFSKNKKFPGGAWATPAMFGNYIYLPTHNGELLTIDKNTGDITSREDVGFHAWSSPNVVDGELIVGICDKSELRSYSLADSSKPILKWTKKVGDGCIESTPTIWKNNIYLSSRDGYFYRISDAVGDEEE